ncbi:MAG: hypothetical protein VX909_05305 [Candidatus Thermoplasmatota archaeon]|nr:hypothetical protein [Candidatus Thermoplasmatota archaeon]MEE2650405.1 hypothetical protein [Candidatus Thermoplasmatota archaeon]
MNDWGSTKVSYNLEGHSWVDPGAGNGSADDEYGMMLTNIYHIQVSFAVYFELHPVTVHQ